MSGYLNDPGAPLSGVRTPRFRVLAGGTPVAGGIEVEIENNNHYTPDHFSMQLSLNAMGAQPISYWGGTDVIEIEIQAGFNVAPNAVLPTVFIGEVEHVEADPVTGDLHITGKDLSRRFSDNKTQETFQNNTSSEVATILANRRGLTPVVTPTDTLVSRYYIEDHDHLTGDQFTRTMTEWDLLVYLAQLEGFDVFVAGKELHFQPVTQSSAPPFVVRLDNGDVPKLNVERLHLERSLTLAQDIEVWVRSWHPHKKTGFTKRAKGKKASSTGSDAFTKKAGTPGPNHHRVVIIRPNLTEDAAQKLANSIRADLTQHERIVEFDMPGDSRPNARDRVQVQGTNSSWDQDYYVASVTRRLGWRSGYTMTVQAKNTSPQNETIAG